MILRFFKMGAAASIDLKVVQAHPQYTILGNQLVNIWKLLSDFILFYFIGDAKVREIYGANNTTLDFEISRKHVIETVISIIVSMYQSILIFRIHT